MLLMCYIAIFQKEKNLKNNVQSKNNVHFYIARDVEGDLTLWLEKPYRATISGIWCGHDRITCIATTDQIYLYNLCPKDFDNLKWEDEPVEVFINLED